MFQFEAAECAILFLRTMTCTLSLEVFCFVLFCFSFLFLPFCSLPFLLINQRQVYVWIGLTQPFYLTDSSFALNFRQWDYRFQGIISKLLLRHWYLSQKCMYEVLCGNNILGTEEIFCQPMQDIWLFAFPSCRQCIFMRLVTDDTGQLHQWKMPTCSQKPWISQNPDNPVILDISVILYPKKSRLSRF